MNDFFGVKLELGDTVAFNPPYYKGLIRGIVRAFTPQKVKVEYVWQGRSKTTHALPQDLAKRPKSLGPEGLPVGDVWNNCNEGCGSNFEIGGPRDVAYGT